MAEFQDFLSLVRPELPGCPAPVILTHANRVVRDFCARTWAWSEWLEQWTEEGFDTYRLTFSTQDRQVLAVSRLWMDGGDIPAASTDFPGYEDGNDDSGPERRAYVFQPPQTVRLLFTPASEQQFFVYVVFQPTTSATDFSDNLLSYYEDGISAGIKSRLMLQPGQNWSNPQLGEYYRKIYEREVGRARIDAHKSYSGASVRVQPRRFI